MIAMTKRSGFNVDEVEMGARENETNVEKFQGKRGRKPCQSFCPRWRYIHHQGSLLLIAIDQ